MKASVPLDPATGMPALPAPYFWRVKPVGPEPKYAFYVYVQLRQKTLIGSLDVASQMAAQADVYGPTLADAVLVAAKDIYRDNFLRRPVPGADYRALLGDYPPKSLGPQPSIDGSADE